MIWKINIDISTKRKNNKKTSRKRLYRPGPCDIVLHMHNFLQTIKSNFARSSVLPSEQVLLRLEALCNVAEPGPVDFDDRNT